MIAWGPWRPDVGGPNSGFAQTADSVLPQAAASGIGYGPFPALVTPTDAMALPAAPKGIISVIDQGGTNKVFAGTSDTLYEMDSAYQWTSIATGYSVPAGDVWSFIQFGSFLLNTNVADGFRAYNIETPAGNNTVTSAPTARYLFQCNNVVFALDCNGNNRRMESSGIGDHTAWDSKGADGKTFEDGGALIAGVDLNNGNALVFQSDAMRLIQFNGAPDGALYRISTVADGRGSVGSRSVVSFDGMVFYIATDGFYKFDMGNGNSPIGAEKASRWFLGQLDVSDLSNVEGSVDPLNKIVCWRYRSTNDASETVYESLICYDWQLNEFFTASVETSALSRIATPGYTLDGMDALGPLDSIDIPLDSRFFQGGEPVFAALDADYKFATFTGSAMAGTLESCVMNSPVTGLFQAITPIDDESAGTLQIGTSEALTDTITWETGVTKGPGGVAKFRARGLNVAFRRNMPAGSTWTYSNGVDHPKSSQGGPR